MVALHWEEKYYMCNGMIKMDVMNEKEKKNLRKREHNSIAAEQV